MALRYLLDTDVLSSLIREPGGSAAREIGRRGASAVCTSIIVAGELRFGARKAASERLTTRVEAILAAITVYALDASADEHYADIRQFLARNGTPIGPNDLWIAAHARSLDLIAVTGNDRKFSHVPDLRVENWLRGDGS